MKFVGIFVSLATLLAAVYFPSAGAGVYPALGLGADDDIKAVASQGRGTAEGRAAWDKLVAAGPTILPQLLQAMNGADTVASNWLRTAFDAIVDREMQKGGKGINAGALLTF